MPRACLLKHRFPSAPTAGCPQPEHWRLVTGHLRLPVSVGSQVPPLPLLCLRRLPPHRPRAVLPSALSRPHFCSAIPLATVAGPTWNLHAHAVMGEAASTVLLSTCLCYTHCCLCLCVGLASLASRVSRPRDRGP